MNYKILLIMLLSVLVISGCTDNKVTGQVTAKLKQDIIKNGGASELTIKGINTGKVAANIILKIIPENSNKVMISYPGNLEYTLQAKEDTGSKIVSVQGFTDYSSTTYWIKIQLINKANSEILDEKTEWITIKK